jgi:hypothetical protein
MTMVSLRQESSGKEEETRTQKPFVETLRVRIPPGKAGPAARSESCVVVRQLALRSDSQVKGRVIEPPKKQAAWSLRPGHRRGRVRQLMGICRDPFWCRAHGRIASTHIDGPDPLCASAARDAGPRFANLDLRLGPGTGVPCFMSVRSLPAATVRGELHTLCASDASRTQVLRFHAHLVAWSDCITACDGHMDARTLVHDYRVYSTTHPGTTSPRLKWHASDSICAPSTKERHPDQPLATGRFGTVTRTPGRPRRPAPVVHGSGNLRCARARCSLRSMTRPGHLRCWP